MQNSFTALPVPRELGILWNDKQILEYMNGFLGSRSLTLTDPLMNMSNTKKLEHLSGSPE